MLSFDKNVRKALLGHTSRFILTAVKAALAVASRAAVLVEGRERIVAAASTLKEPGVLEKLFFPAAEAVAP